MHYHSAYISLGESTEGLIACSDGRVTCHESLDEAIAYVTEPLGNEVSAIRLGGLVAIVPATAP